MTGMLGSTSRAARSTSSPLALPGRRRSVRTTEIREEARTRRASPAVRLSDDGIALPLERPPQHGPKRIPVLDHENVERTRGGLGIRFQCGYDHDFT